MIDNLNVDHGLEIGKKLLIFQCLTGHSFADIPMYPAHNWDGHAYRYVRQKTKTECQIPFNERLQRFIRDVPVMLIPSYSSYRKWLHQITREFDLDIEIKPHTGRKTFGYLMFCHGFTLEEVSAMLGHTKVETTRKFYVNVDLEAILKRKALRDSEVVV
jgi:integrase